MLRLSVLACMLMASTSSAQIAVDWTAWFATPDSGWSHFYNEAHTVAVGSTGRVAVGCTSSASNTPWMPMVTRVYQADGSLAWSQSASFDQYNSPCAILVDLTGGVFAAGTSYQWDCCGNERSVLLHYDPFGNLLWTRQGTWGTAAVALAPCSNGDVIVAGMASYERASIDRLDPSGNIVWNWTCWLGPQSPWPFPRLSDVAIGPGGDVWATGSVRRAGSIDVFVARLSSGGNPLWFKTFDGPNHGYDVGNSIAVDAAGSAWVAGSIDTQSGGSDAAIARWDPSGALAWVRIYGGTANGSDSASKIALDPFGRAIAAGEVASSAPAGGDFALWCLDTPGNLIWTGTWDGGTGGTDHPSDLVVDASGSALVCGRTAESGVAGAPNDLVVVCWDSTGGLRWTWRHAGAHGTEQGANCAALTGAGVVVAGDSERGSSDPAVILHLVRTVDEH